MEIRIGSIDGTGEIQASKVWAVKTLPISPTLAASQQDIMSYSHLNGIKLPELKNAKVSVLIGLDNPDAHHPKN